MRRDAKSVDMNTTIEHDGACDAPLRRGAILETLVGYYSPPGHDHDDNCEVRMYVCDAGHRFTVSLRKRCSAPGCDWVGRCACPCHPGLKVDAWPEALDMGRYEAINDLMRSTP